MGCDIHAHVEVERRGYGVSWEYVGKLQYDGRNYGLFGWLADVRNYSAVPKTPITVPGVPPNLTREVAAEIRRWGVDGHSHYYADLAELAAVDYEQVVRNRRVTRKVSAGYYDGGCTDEAPDGGVDVKLVDLIGNDWVKAVREATTTAAGRKARVILWFDN